PPRPESVREPEEVFLVDRVQHLDGRPLDDLVLQRGHRERALSTVRLGYVLSPARLRPVRSAVDPGVQDLELALEVRLVVLPPQPVDPGGGVPLERIERLPEQAGTDVVKERGELFLPSFLCCLPYARQRLCHAFPVLRPARALLVRISLGPGPWLHRLRNGLLRVVR